MNSKFQRKKNDAVSGRFARAPAPYKAAASPIEDHMRKVLEAEFQKIIDRQGSLTVDELMSLRVLLSSAFPREELAPVLAEMVAKSFELKTQDSRTLARAVP